MDIGFALGEWMHLGKDVPTPTSVATTIDEFSPGWAPQYQEPVPPLISMSARAGGSVMNGTSYFPWETKALPAAVLNSAPFSSAMPVPFMLEEPVPPLISSSARATGSMINGTSCFPWETQTVPAEVLNTAPFSYARTGPFMLEETAFTGGAPATPIKGAPIVVTAPQEEIAAPIQVAPVQQVPQVQQVVQTVAPRLVIEKVLHEKSLGLTFREVEGMLNKLRSNIFMELDAVLKQDARALPCELPAVGPLLEEQQASMKADIEETLQKERAAFQEMRSGLLQEVTGKLQQTCGLLLPEMHAIVQKAHCSIEEKVEEMLQEALQDERSYIFGTMQDLMQQQLTTLSRSTDAEFGKMVTMINGVSTVCGDRMERLESSFAACTSSLKELKKDLAKVADKERSARLDSTARLDSETSQALIDTNMSAVLQELRRDETSQALIDTNMSAVLQEMRRDFSDMNAKVSGLASDVAGHSQHVSMMAKVNDVMTDLHKDVQSCRASLSDTLQPAHLAQHRIEHTAAMTSLQNISTNNKEELIKLVQTEGKARMLLEEAVVAVGDETRMIKDKVARLDKLSTELSGEVQVCAATMRRSPSKRTSDKQSLDRYREILALRESP